MAKYEEILKEDFRHYDPKEDPGRVYEKFLINSALDYVGVEENITSWLEEEEVESPLEKSLRLVNGLMKREDVSGKEKQRVLSQVRKWGCYEIEKSPWKMDSREVEVYFMQTLNGLRKKLNYHKDLQEGKEEKGPKYGLQLKLFS